MKRMICFISQQPLPNFIPVNEPSTRPDVLYGFFTPGEHRMATRWTDLAALLERRFPEIKLESVEIPDAYDAQFIRVTCAELLSQFSQDQWSVNATGGTKIMSSPAVDLFRQKGYDIYYVESPRNRSLRIKADWSVDPLPFTESIDLETYFRIYGREVRTGKPVSGQEGEVYRQLERLDWQVWPNVRVLHKGDSLAEYDVIAIRHYQLFAFECKRLNRNQSQGTDSKTAARGADSIRRDLLKLYQVQQHFGGPFGKSYWIFSGSHPVSEINAERIRDFGINFIRSGDINSISKTPEKFGLPHRKPNPMAMVKSINGPSRPSIDNSTLAK